MTSDFCRLWSIPPGHQGAAKDLWKWVTRWVFLPEEIHGTCSFVVQIFSTKLYPRNLQQVQQDRSWMDPEKTWESNSSIATLLGVRWDSVPFNFWWIFRNLLWRVVIFQKFPPKSPTNSRWRSSRYSTDWQHLGLQRQTEVTGKVVGFCSELPGTLNNHFKWMFGETTIFYVMIRNHPKLKEA